MSIMLKRVVDGSANPNGRIAKRAIEIEDAIARGRVG